MKITFKMDFSINDGEHPGLVRKISYAPFELKSITIEKLYVVKVELVPNPEFGGEATIFLKPDGELKIE